MLKSEETAEAIAAFVDRQVDELLTRRVGDTLSEDAFNQILQFRSRIVLHGWSAKHGFEQKIGDFVSGRLDDLARSNATLAETFTPETIAFHQGTHRQPGAADRAAPRGHCHQPEHAQTNRRAHQARS